MLSADSRWNIAVVMATLDMDSCLQIKTRMDGRKRSSGKGSSSSGLLLEGLLPP